MSKKYQILIQFIDHILLGKWLSTYLCNLLFRLTQFSLQVIDLFLIVIHFLILFNHVLLLVLKWTLSANKEVDHNSYIYDKSTSAAQWIFIRLEHKIISKAHFWTISERSTECCPNSPHFMVRIVSHWCILLAYHSWHH